jgi:uncharacterized membrane protein
MKPIRVFRAGNETFCEWRFENGQDLGRILNQGTGAFLENEFSSIADAKAFCERELEKDKSLIFYVMSGDDIIDVIQNQAYHIAREKRENRIYAVVSIAVVMLLALGVSVMVMPFHAMTSHLLFISSMGLLYVLLYLIAGSWNFESVVAIAIILVLVSLLVPQLTKHTESNQSSEHTQTKGSE